MKVGWASIFLVIGANFANPQSAQLKRWAARLHHIESDVMSLFPMMITKSFFINALIGLTILFCCPFISAPRIVSRPELKNPSEITRAHFITQDVNIIDNPLSSELLNCAVITGVAQDNNPWIKIEKEEVKSINIIESDINGRMWLATDGNGLTMFDGMEWHNWQPEAGRDMGYVAFRTMTVSDGKVYAGAYGSASGGKLLSYDIERDEWSTIRGLSGNVVGGVAISDQGEISAATTSGVDIYRNGRWTGLRFPLRAMFTKLYVDDALFDKENNYWMATATGLWMYDGNGWTVFTADDGYLPTNEVNALAVDRENRIWTATANGLAVYDNRKWWIFPTEKYPWFSGWLREVTVDSEGRVWVAKADLVTVYNGKDIATFEPSVVGDGFWDDAISFDQQGCVWIDISSELAILRGRVNMGAGQFNFE